MYDDSSNSVVDIDGSHSFEETYSRPQHSRRKEYPGLYFRSILPQDRQQIQILHEKWFPVQYNDEFYDALVQGRLAPPPVPSSEPPQKLERRSSRSRSDVDQSFESLPDDMEPLDQDDQSSYGDQRELYTYLALKDTESRNQCQEDFVLVCQETSSSKGNELSSMENGRSGIASANRIVACIVGAMIDGPMLSPEMQSLLLPDPERHPHLFYIMTLGTADDYRQHGLASFLVQQCIAQQIETDSSCGTLYLHVLDTNQAAIRFYEKLGFYRVKLIPNYYTIDGEMRHCYLYAKYFHGTCFWSLSLCFSWLECLWKGSFEEE